MPEPASELFVEPSAPPRTIAVPQPASDRDDRSRSERRKDAGRQPWGTARDRQSGGDLSDAGRRQAGSPSPRGRDGRRRIVTGKWWDSKGPRVIELGPKGQQRLGSGFFTLFVLLLVASVAALVVEPILLLVGALLLFQFGGKILGPAGSAIVDKAVAERD